MILTKFHIGKILGSKNVKDGVVFTYDPQNTLLTAFKDVFVDFKKTNTHTILHLDDNVDVYISKKSKLLIQDGEFVSERKGIAILDPSEPVYVHSKNTGPVMNMKSPFHIPVSANPNQWRNFDFFFKFLNVIDKKVLPSYDLDVEEDKESLSANADGIFRNYLFKQDTGFDLNARFWDDGLKNRERKFIDNLKKRENGLRSGHMFQFIVQCGNDEDAYRFKFLNLEPYIEEQVRDGYRKYVRANDNDEKLIDGGDLLYIRDLNKYYPYLSRWRFGEVRYDKMFTQVDPGNEDVEHHKEVLKNCRILYWFNRYIGILKEFIISASLNHLTTTHNGKRMTNVFVKTDYVGHYEEEVDLKLYKFLTQNRVPRDEIKDIIPEYASHRQDLINNAVKLLHTRNPSSYFFNFIDVGFRTNFGFATESIPSIEVEEEGETVKKSLKDSFQKLTEAAIDLTRNADTKDVMYFSATLRDYYEVSLGEYFRELLKQYADERLSKWIESGEASSLVQGDFRRITKKLQQYKKMGDFLIGWQAELLTEPITFHNTKMEKLNDDLRGQNYGQGDSSAISKYWDMVKELLLKGGSGNDINQHNIFSSLSNEIKEKLGGCVGNMLKNFKINLNIIREDVERPPEEMMNMYTNILEQLEIDTQYYEGRIDQKILRRFVFDRVRDIYLNMNAINPTTKYNTVEGMTFVRDRYKEAMVGLVRFFPDYVTLFQKSYLDYVKQRLKVCFFQIIWGLRAANSIGFRHNDLHLYNVRMKYINRSDRKDLLFFNLADEPKVRPRRRRIVPRVDDSVEGEDEFDDSVEGEDEFDDSVEGEIGNPITFEGERGISPPQTLQNVYPEIQGENHNVESRDGENDDVWRLDFKIPSDYYTHSLVIIDFDRSEMNYGAFFDKLTHDRRPITRGFPIAKKRDVFNRMNSLMKASMYFWDNLWVKSETQDPEKNGDQYKQYETKEELNTEMMDTFIDLKKLIQELEMSTEELVEQTKNNDIKMILDEQFFEDIFKTQYSFYRPDSDKDLPWILDHPYFEEFKNYHNEFDSENINDDDEEAFWNTYIPKDIEEEEGVWQTFILGYGREQTHHLLKTCTFERNPNQLGRNPKQFGRRLEESVEYSLKEKSMQGLTKYRQEKEYQDYKDIYTREDEVDDSGEGPGDVDDSGEGPGDVDDSGEGPGDVDDSGEGQQSEGVEMIIQDVQNLTYDADVEEQGQFSTTQVEPEQIIFQGTQNEIDLQINQSSQDLIMTAPREESGFTPNLYAGQFYPETPIGDDLLGTPLEDVDLELLFGDGVFDIQGMNEYNLEYDNLNT